MLKKIWRWAKNTSAKFRAFVRGWAQWWHHGQDRANIIRNKSRPDEIIAPVEHKHCGGMGYVNVRLYCFTHKIKSQMEIYHLVKNCAKIIFEEKKVLLRFVDENVSWIKYNQNSSVLKSKKRLFRSLLCPSHSSWTSGKSRCSRVRNTWSLNPSVIFKLVMWGWPYLLTSESQFPYV